eukprot:7816468-Lingulodinium_polyedra.AAC.1
MPRATSPSPRRPLQRWRGGCRSVRRQLRSASSLQRLWILRQTTRQRRWSRRSCPRRSATTTWPNSTAA